MTPKSMRLQVSAFSVEGNADFVQITLCLVLALSLAAMGRSFLWKDMVVCEASLFCIHSMKYFGGPALCKAPREELEC